MWKYPIDENRASVGRARRALVSIAWLAIVGTGASACGDAGEEGDAAFDRCMDAFARIAARPEAGSGARSALRYCDNIADWQVAAKAHPKATEGEDPVVLLARLCSSSPKETTPYSGLCRQAFHIHPELKPADAGPE